MRFRVLSVRSKPVRRSLFVRELSHHHQTEIAGEASTVGGWVWEENVDRALRHMAVTVGYPYDDLDAGAVETGLRDTDEDRDCWFEYPVVGQQQLTVSLARNLGASPVSLRVTGDLDEVLVARIETVLSVLSDPR